MTDGEFCHRTVSNMLEQSGYEVSQAEDGQDGQEAVISTPPDLIIYDIDMPKVDGFAMADRLD